MRVYDWETYDRPARGTQFAGEYTSGTRILSGAIKGRENILQKGTTVEDYRRQTLLMRRDQQKRKRNRDRGEEGRLRGRERDKDRSSVGRPPIGSCRPESTNHNLTCNTVNQTRDHQLVRQRAHFCQLARKRDSRQPVESRSRCSGSRNNQQVENEHRGAARRPQTARSHFPRGRESRPTLPGEGPLVKSPERPTTKSS